MTAPNRNRPTLHIVSGDKPQRKPGWVERSSERAREGDLIMTGRGFVRVDDVASFLGEGAC